MRVKLKWISGDVRENRKGRKRKKGNNERNKNDTDFKKNRKYL